MPIVSTVGRRAPKMRLLVAAMYAILTIGAVSVVYPFLLMLATSITSSPDATEFRVVPRYLNDDDVLFAKFVDDKYAGDIDVINGTHDTDIKKAIDARLPANLRDPRLQRLLAEWREFAATIALDNKALGFRGYGVHPSELSLAYRRHLRSVFGDDVEALNRAYGEENASFNQVMPPAERPTGRTWAPTLSPKMRDFIAWKASLPERWLVLVSVDGLFGQYLRDFEDVPWATARLAALDERPPKDSVQRGRWERFVRTKLPLRYVRTSPKCLSLFHSFLQAKYGSVDALNLAWVAKLKSFAEVRLPDRVLPDSSATRDFGEFIAKAIPLDMVRVWTPENAFRARLLAKYGGIEAINDAFGLHAKALTGIAPPKHADDAQYVVENRSSLRVRFAGRNYGQVIDYVLLHGRALWVTVLFCAAAVITALIVNPLCAYALSRFNLPYAYSVLLFVLATMAFPGEVVMIPNFLMLKEFGLLNTFAALLLPGMANGFSIFLLKGFFDSLPNELYESGTIDGASELRMFFKVTIPMSKPIFAVIALGAFTAAYGAFMFALLVCQDPKMWTLMVWLYDLQGTAPQYVMMAALTLAALPTLIVFAFAQKVIMRGIIIPMEK